MDCLKFTLYLSLLFTVPSMSLFSQSTIPIFIVNSEQPVPFSLSCYDDILGLIDDLEDGSLETKCTAADLDRITNFLTALAKEGLLPDQIEEMFLLEHDILALNEAKQNPYYFAFDDENDLGIYPAIYYGDGQVFQCNWFSKQWRQTRNFVKKHKKAIIIGAVVIVAVATIYGIVAATATAGVEGIGLATAPDNNYGSSSNSSDYTPLPPINADPPVASVETTIS